MYAASGFYTQKFIVELKINQDLLKELLWARRGSLVHQLPRIVDSNRTVALTILNPAFRKILRLLRYDVFLMSGRQMKIEIMTVATSIRTVIDIRDKTVKGRHKGVSSVCATANESPCNALTA
jgi:hypothetical protein